MLLTSKCLLKKIVKIVHSHQAFLAFVITRNIETPIWLEHDKIRLALLISYFNESY